MSCSLLTRLIVLFACLFFTACNRPSPEKAFDVAVLNSNMLIGFANEGMERELTSPTMKMGKTKDEFFPMKRSEVVETKTKFVEENYEKLKAFQLTDETKEIVQESLAMHELILPVYKNEYKQLARLYDEGAPKEEVEKLQQGIQEKYFPKFEVLYSKLINSGKLYAKEHHIKVNWAM